MRITQCFGIILFLLTWSEALLPRVAEARDVTVAVVRDGPTRADALLPLLEAELARLLGSADSARLLEKSEFSAGFTAQGARQAIQAALDDPQVDLLMGLGILVTQEAAVPGLALSKPFVSAFDRRSDLPEIPWESGGSLKPNLALIVIPQRAENDAYTLLQMIPADTLYVGVDAQLAGQIPGLDSALASYEESLGVAIAPVPIDDDPIASIQTLPSTARAFYVTDLPRLDADQRRTLFETLSGRGIAAFSGVGHPDVEIGAFAGLTPDVTELLVRRVALNIESLIDGRSTADLPVVLPVKMSLLVNGRTARALGYVPTSEALAYGTFLHADALSGDAEALSLENAMRTAETSNVSLAVRTAAVETSQRDKQRSFSPILPQVGANAGYNWSQTLAPNGLLPEELGSAGLSVSQMIYDDRLVSGYRTSDRLYRSSQFDREAQRLDVLAQAGTQYLLLVQSRAIVDILAENVRLTRDNLELAEIRYDVGYSGQDEVFRWQAELASRRADMMNSDALARELQIQLNQVLGVAQDSEWAIEEVMVAPGEFPFLDGRVTGALADVGTARRFGDFLVETATRTSPELAFFDQRIEGQSIQVAERKRRFLIPAFYFGFSWDYLYEWEPELVDRRDDIWTASLFATYPLFEGGGRYYDLQREQSARRELEYEREQARQLVESRTRAALERVGNRYPVIALTVESAEASRKNLEVVRDKYAEGIVNVTDLLEAQNQSVTAEQLAAISVYQFLVDLIDLQRSISWFEFEKTAQERDAMVAAILDAIAGRADVETP